MPVAPDFTRRSSAAFDRARTLESVLTPCLVVDEAGVESNIATAIDLIGSAERWRVHCKTAKAPWTMRKLLDHDVRSFKAATVVEVEHLLRTGATDVLFSLPAVGATQRALVDLAEQYPSARVSVLLDDTDALTSWARGRLGFFLDVNTGMDRTGVPVDQPDDANRLIRHATELGFSFRGLHHYDGHLASLPDDARTEAVHCGLDRLTRLASSLYVGIPEIVTGGSHTFLPALQHEFPPALSEVLTVSPGTVVYCDLRSLERFGDIGFRPAVAVLCRVISSPTADNITVDAGLTAIQVDAGTPHAAVSNEPNAVVGTPAQEHLSIRFPAERRPAVGSLLTLVPRHVDTTVAQFDQFLVISPGGATMTHLISARHH